MIAKTDCVLRDNQDPIVFKNLQTKNAKDADINGMVFQCVNDKQTIQMEPIKKLSYSQTKGDCIEKNPEPPLAPTVVATQLACE